VDDDEDRLFRSLIFITRDYNQDDVIGEDDRVFNELVSNLFGSTLKVFKLKDSLKTKSNDETSFLAKGLKW